MGTNQYQLQFTITHPYQIVIVSCLFVLDLLLSAERPGQTYSSLHLMGQPTPPAYNKQGIVFYIRKGPWGGGAYYLGGAG